MPPRISRSHHPALALSVTIAVLVVVLAGLLFWKGSIQYGLIPANHPMTSSARGKVVTSAATVGLVSVAIAGGIGAACYFLFRRSSNAALIGMAITMMLPAGAIGYQLCNYGLNGPAPAGPSTVQTPATSLAQQPQKEFEKGRETLRELAQGPSPLTRSTSPPISLEQNSSPAPLTVTPLDPATPLPTAPRPITPAPKPKKQADPNVQKQLDDLKAAVNAQIQDAVTKLEPALAVIAKTPRSDLADLRKRAKLIQAAKEVMAPLAARLRDLADEAKAAAEKGGATNSLHDGIQFSNLYGAHQRSFAGNQIVRMLDQAASETQVLTDNYGRWKLNKEGQIESKDFKLQTSANSDRFFINAALRSKDETVRNLKGE